MSSVFFHFSFICNRSRFGAGVSSRSRSETWHYCKWNYPVLLPFDAHLSSTGTCLQGDSFSIVDGSVLLSKRFGCWYKYVVIESLCRVEPVLTLKAKTKNIRSAKSMIGFVRPKWITISSKRPLRQVPFSLPSYHWYRSIPVVSWYNSIIVVVVVVVVVIPVVIPFFGKNWERKTLKKFIHGTKKQKSEYIISSIVSSRVWTTLIQL